MVADPHGRQPAEYPGASVDGSKVFFDSDTELTGDANTGSEDNAANLYEYDLESGRLIDLTLDINSATLMVLPCSDWLRLGKRFLISCIPSRKG